MHIHIRYIEIPYCLSPAAYWTSSNGEAATPVEATQEARAAQTAWVPLESKLAAKPPLVVQLPQLQEAPAMQLLPGPHAADHAKHYLCGPNAVPAP